MTTMHRSSNDLSVWAPLLLVAVLVAVVLSGLVSGIEIPAPSVGFEPPGVPEQISSEMPAYAEEMAVYGETGAVHADIMPVYLVEEQVAGG